MTTPTRKRRNHTVKPRRKDQNDKFNGSNKQEDDFFATITPTSNSLNQVALICAVVGFVLYMNTIWTCGFCYDDAVAIIANPDVLSSHKELAPSTSLFQVFEHDFWGLPVTDMRSHKSYRPIAIVSLRMDAYIAYVLGMRGEPAVFHFFNAVFYSLTCWILVKSMLAPIITTQNILEQQHTNINTSILLSGLWFATHPVHTESVAGLVGRADLLAAIFSMLGTKFHFEKKTLACVFTFILAFLCKETTVMIPMVLVVATGVVHMAASPNTKAHSLNHWSAAIMLVAISLGYIQFRSWLFMGDQTLNGVKLTDNFLLHISLGATKFRTALYIQVKYLWLLLFPNQLSCDYGLGVVNPITSWFSIEMIHVAVMILILMGWARFAMVRLESTGNIVPLLALGWTVAPLLPASHIVDIGTVMAERLLFLPSIGTTLLLLYVLSSIHPKRQSQLAFLLVVCIALFSYKTITRNPNWADTKTLFQVDLETHPKSLKTLIANIRTDVGQDTATRYSERAQAILKEHEHVFAPKQVERTRATIVLHMADLKMNASDTVGEALLYADSLIHRHQETGNAVYVMAHAKKARSLLMLGIEQNDVSILQDAVQAYKLATSAGQVVDNLYWFDIQEGKARAYYALFRLLNDEKMLKEAVDAFRIVVIMGDVYGDNDERWMEIQLTAGKAFFRLGVSTSNLALLREALGVYRKAIESGTVDKDSPRAADLYEELGKTLLQLGPAMRVKDMIVEAANAFRVAIEYGDNNENIYIYCMHGTALAMLNDDIKAHEEFQKCFSRESHVLTGNDVDNNVFWEDRFGYRRNYAILMQKLSGVREMNHDAMRKWGRPALKAIDTMLTMAKENESRIILPQDKVQEWIIVMNAIQEQLDIHHSEL